MRLTLLALALGCAQARDLPAPDVDAAAEDSPGPTDAPAPSAPADVSVVPPSLPEDAAPASREDAGNLCPCDTPPPALDCNGKTFSPPLKVTGLFLAAAPVEMSGDFCAMSIPVSGMDYAWEPTADYAAFLAKWRPRICDGRPKFTALTLVVWSFDPDGTHGTKAIASQACP